MTEDQMKKLFELKQLFDGNIITKEELEIEKAKILGSTSPNSFEEEKQQEVLEEKKQVQFDYDSKTIVENNSNPPQKNNKIYLWAGIGIGVLIGILLLVFGIMYFSNNSQNNISDNLNNISNTTPNTNSNNTSSNQSTNSTSDLSNNTSTNQSSNSSSNTNYNNNIVIHEDGDYEDGFEYLWEVGSSRAYTYKDLEDLSKAELRILRNYFYAKNGYSFKKIELRNHFSQYSWYIARYSDIDNSWFTKIQNDNIAFIKKLE